MRRSCWRTFSIVALTALVFQSLAACGGWNSGTDESSPATSRSELYALRVDYAVCERLVPGLVIPANWRTMESRSLAAPMCSRDDDFLWKCSTGKFLPRAMILISDFMVLMNREFARKVGLGEFVDIDPRVGRLERISIFEDDIAIEGDPLSANSTQFLRELCSGPWPSSGDLGATRPVRRTSNYWIVRGR